MFEPGFNLHTFRPREIWGWAERLQEGRRVFWVVKVEIFEGVIHVTDPHRTEEKAVAAARTWLREQGHDIPDPQPDPFALVAEVVRRVRARASAPALSPTPR